MNRPPFSPQSPAIYTDKQPMPHGPAPTLATLPTYTQVLSASIQPTPGTGTPRPTHHGESIPSPAISAAAATANHMQDPFAFMGPNQPLTNDLLGHDVAASYRPNGTSVKPLTAPWRTGIIAVGCVGLLLAVVQVAALAGLLPPAVFPANEGLKAFKTSLLASDAQAFLARDYNAQGHGPSVGFPAEPAAPRPARPTFKVGAGVTIDNKRIDPLAPLVQAVKPAPLTPEETIKADPVLGMNFVGLVQGNGRQADVAMVEVIDAATQETKTLVKPIGELFYTNGSAVQIKRASQGLLEVTVDGQLRRLPLTLGQAEGTGAKKDKPGDGLDKLSE
jgi:hypothetical protein